MMCGWEGVQGILPLWLRQEISSGDDIQEIRLRLGKPTQLIKTGCRQWVGQPVSRQDLSFCINAASRYSPWAAASSARGYLTARGGHRIGICGEALIREGTVAGIREVSSLCIRVARDFPGIARKAADLSGSVLILGAPGWGKTTLLRDLIRQRARRETVAVADERGELFPQGFEIGQQTDILSGCPKTEAIGQLLRTMGPQTIAADEITSPEDCQALLEAAGCGVSLLATAHAGSLKDYQHRIVYAPLLENRIFQNFLVLKSDKTYEVEHWEP